MTTSLIVASIWTSDEKLLIISNFGVAITAILVTATSAALALYTYRVWMVEQDHHDEEMQRLSNVESDKTDADIEQLNATIENTGKETGK